MDYPLNEPVQASTLAGALQLKLSGTDALVTGVADLSAASAGALVWTRKADRPLPGGVIAIAPAAVCASCIIVENPRLAFARAVAFLRRSVGFAIYAAPPVIDASAKIGRNVSIANGAVIGADTIIGDNVVIGEGVRVGAACTIKANTVIGQDGFGFERDADGIPHRIVHLGSVVIGDNVEIGALNTVCRGTLGDTVIENHVKTDDHVHVAHNCRIGTASLLTACVELSGGVTIGAYGWVGPNSSVIQKAVLGERAFVGIGSNVVADVAAGAVVAGNPAKPR